MDQRKNNLRHYLDTVDFTKEELLSMLETIKLLKDAEKQGIRPAILKDLTLGMMFDQPSTRTRISFETAMTHLGGHAQFLEFKNLHLGEKRESLRDTAEVISRMVDTILIRTDSHEFVEAFAEYSYVPVINGMTMEGGHPTQVLCDVFTMIEHMPKGKKLEDLVVMFIGDNNNSVDTLAQVAITMARICATLGITFISCSPDRLQIGEKDKAIVDRLNAISGGKLIMTSDPYENIKDVDFIVADAWWYHGSDDLKDERLKLLYPTYQINQKLINAGPKHIKAMHCLPGNRDFEITSEVWDGENSCIFDEAENRLHTEKGILAWFMYNRKKNPTDSLVKYHTGKIEDHLSKLK